MPWQTIKKPPERQSAANLSDYEDYSVGFSLNQVRQELDGLPDNQGLNIAFEAVDRHAVDSQGHRLALRWLGKSNQVRDYSYLDLAQLSNQFANVLKQLHIAKGDCVVTLLGRVPELYIAVLGTLKNASVLCPLFSAFGPEPLAARLTLSEAKILVTTDTLYQRRKLADLRGSLPHLQHVLLIADNSKEAALPPDTLNLQTLLSEADSQFTIPPSDPEDAALLHFTSGTTGKPKGVLHVHGAVLSHYLTGKLVLDLKPSDIFWCTADPGWVTGVSYGIIAPFVTGVTNLVDEAEFNPERWYQILQNQQVNVWYTAPTAIRMLMKSGSELARRYDLSHLRVLGSAGEPLNPEAVLWSQETFATPFHDTWWQTETGSIMIANFPSLDVKPGAMGRPMPGVEAAIVQRTRLGGITPVNQPDQVGELALRVGWPSQFRAYLHEDLRYRQCFADGYYLTGDLVRCDGDGYFWFVGRADDVINSAGHLISPFEVESVLMSHPGVAEAGVIGKPDPIAMEVVKAFVSLKAGYKPSDSLNRELLGLARQHLGAAVAPREIDFQDNLPKTRSGKILRRLLKARELGLPEGDLSTLEENQ
jgi:acetyl-CoA synthetase